MPRNDYHHLDELPTQALRDQLAADRRTWDAQRRINFDHALEDLDRQIDFLVGQNKMRRARIVYLEAQHRQGRGWRLVEALERLLKASADTARERRHAAIEGKKRDDETD